MGIVGQEAKLGYDAAGWLQHDLGSSGISCPHDSTGSARPSQAKYDLVGCDVTRVPFSRTITCAVLTLFALFRIHSKTRRLLSSHFKLSHLFLTWLFPGLLYPVSPWYLLMQCQSTAKLCSDSGLLDIRSEDETNRGSGLELPPINFFGFETLRLIG